MNNILFADGHVGLEIAEFLIQNFKEDLALIITIEENNIFRKAQNFGVQTLVFTTSDELINKLPADLDFGLLAWWPKLIPKTLIECAKYGFINTHPSFLPFNKGKNYNFWALVEQNPFGVSLHQVDEGIDTGPILAQREIYYDWTDTGETLFNKAQSKIIELFTETYPKIRSGKVVFKKQNESEGSFHFASEMDAVSKIDLDKYYKSRDLINLLRARTFEGYPGCWFMENEEKYEISIKVKKVL